MGITVLLFSSTQVTQATATIRRTKETPANPRRLHRYIRQGNDRGKFAEARA